MKLFHRRLDLILEALDTRIQALSNQIKKALDNNNHHLKRLIAQNELGNSLETIIRFIGEFDPTNGSAVPWIIKLITKGRIHLPDDRIRLMPAIELFNKVKKRSEFKGNKDLNQYNSLRDLEKAVEPFVDQQSRKQEAERLRKLKDEIGETGQATIYQDSKFKVIMFDCRGKEKVVPIQSYKEEKLVTSTAIEVAEIAQETDWCLKDPMTAQSFLDSGPLYLIHKDNEPYMMADYRFGEFKNQEDAQIVKPSPMTDYFLGTFVKTVPLPRAAIKNINMVRKALKQDYNNRPPIT